MPREDGRELRWYFAVIRRWWWLTVICGLLAAGSAFLVSSQIDPVYRTTTTLLVDKGQSSNSSEYSDILASERLANTYSQMLTGQAVMQAAIAQLGLTESPKALAERVEVNPIPDTQLIRVSVDHTDPDRAVLIANTIAEVFIVQLQVLQVERYAGSLASIQEEMGQLSALMQETQSQIDDLNVKKAQAGAELARLESLGEGAEADIDSLSAEMAIDDAELVRLQSLLAEYRSDQRTLQQDYESLRLTVAQSTDNVNVIEAPQTPGEPVSPRTLMNTMVAALVGVMIGIATPFLLEYLDDTIRLPGDVSEALGLSTLGTIGQVANGQGGLVVAAQPHSSIAETFRMLATNVRYASLDCPLRTLLVVSPGPSEGKSFTAANLAATMAEAGLQVVVVDADLHIPRQHKIFGVDGRHGLTDSLLEGNLDSSLQPSELSGLKVLTSGGLPSNPSAMLGSQKMRELVAELAEKVDLVVIDSSPVLAVADSTVLARAVDGVLLILRAGQTRRQDAQAAVQSLRQVEANLVGVVLNAVPMVRGSYYTYYREGAIRARPRRGRWRWVQRLAARLVDSLRKTVIEPAYQRYLGQHK